MGIVHHLAIVSLLILVACSPAKNPEVEVLKGLSSAQKQTLAAWLTENKSFRPAMDRDCNCDDDIREIRQKGAWGHPLPNFQPYLKTGDFNQDGKNDFAIIAIGKNNQAKRILLVFNGPSSEQPKPPTFTAEISSFEALFYDPPDQPLVVGAFSSEGCIITPKGLRYILDCDYGG